MNNGLMEFLTVFLGASGGLVSLVALFIASAKDKRRSTKSMSTTVLSHGRKSRTAGGRGGPNEGRHRQDERELKAELGRIAVLEEYIQALTAAVKAAYPSTSIPPMAGKARGAKA